MNKFMRLALEEAYKGINEGHGGPFGSVIVNNGVVIAKGHNKVLLKKDSTCHGEIEVIRKACKKLNTFDLSGCEIYTTGEPCPMCLGAILWANISKVYYGCNIVDTEKIGFRDKKFYNFDKSKFVNQLDREECLKLYEAYNDLKGKRNY